METNPFEIGDRVRVINPESKYFFHVGTVVSMHDTGPAWKDRWTIVIRYYQGCERIGFHVGELVHFEDAVQRLARLA